MNFVEDTFQKIYQTLNHNYRKLIMQICSI